MSPPFTCTYESGRNTPLAYMKSMLLLWPAVIQTGLRPRGVGVSTKCSLSKKLITGYRTPLLKSRKLVLLSSLNGWEVDTPRARRDAHWRSMLEGVSEYVASTGWMPRYKTFETEEERVLGMWLHRQHQGRSESTLAPWRLTALDEAIPGWHSSC